MKIVMCLLFMTIVNSAEPKGLPPLDPAKSLVELEQLRIDKGGKGANYSQKALDLLRTATAYNRMDDEWQAAILDIATGIIMRGTASALEFGPNGSSIRGGKAIAVEQLLWNAPRPNAEGQWQGIRDRRARLMLYVRGSYVNMRNAFWDDKTIVEGRGITVFDPDDGDTPPIVVDNNASVSLQLDIKGFLAEVGPRIDKFVVEAYSAKPVDHRTLNEMLAFGGYTVKERRELLRRIASASGTPIPPIVVQQLADEKK